MDYVCPAPMKWSEIYLSLLKIWALKVKNENDKPPIPLILAAWYETSDDMKESRWKGLILWAERHKCSHLIPELKEEEKYRGRDSWK